MQHYEFSVIFEQRYTQALARYEAGCREASALFDSEALEWIRANGLSAQSFFDYAEDHFKYGGEPGLLLAHAIESIRRDYFLNIQQGRPSARTLEPDTLPAKTDSIEGIAWLPRLLPKALAKLRGELPSSLMYSCAGDRRFFREHNIHPAEFLALVWRHEKDADPMAAALAFVKSRSSL